jgi:hypothetical protein
MLRPCISAAAIFRCSTTTMSSKDSVDVDAVARVGLEKLGYKQEMARVCACSFFFYLCFILMIAASLGDWYIYYSVSRASFSPCRRN